jgi:hypothetical protein
MASSALSFSALSVSNNFGTSRLSRQNAAVPQTSAFSVDNNKLSSTQLNVASADSVSITDMEKGVGGRIENAFQAAKEKGEAAFVSFITAGYPTAKGKEGTNQEVEEVHEQK